MDDLVLTEEGIAAFGEWLRMGEKSPNTIAKYVRDVRTFGAFAGDRPITKELVMDYKRQLICGGKHANASINSMLMSLRAFFGYCQIPECKVGGVRMQERPYCPENESLTHVELQRLLRAAEGDARLRMGMKILVGTAIRISELPYFTVEAIDGYAREGCILVHCKNKTREILIPEELLLELRAYAAREGITEGAIIRTKTGKPLDRSNFWRQMKGLCQKAGVAPEKVYPHNLRKLFARTFYEKTYDLAKLSCLLGHSSINTTKIYIKSTRKSVKELIEYLSLGPLFGLGTQEMEG